MAGKYRVKWFYVSSAGGPWEKGDVVELEEEKAEHINRDSPGVLALVPETNKKGKGKGKEAPPHDRMVKEAENRGVEGGDRGAQEPITKDFFKAVKDG